MKCQFCNCPDSRVVDSRPTEEGASIRRRRECVNCGRRFTTYEKVELPQLLVIKEEITTKQIGEMVMQSLRQLDEVAYVRFASVYRQFTDIPTFMRELSHMLDEAGHTAKGE